MTQRFQYTFELAWKTIKDYLEYNGATISPITPRHVLKEAHAAQILTDGQIWIDMLDHRRLLLHTYDANVFESAVDAISAHYLPAIVSAQRFLNQESLK